MTNRVAFCAVVAMALVRSATPLLSFCGFYVAKVDTKLFNKASQVVLVRDGDRTVVTMANDFQGDLKEFAIVIPLPTLLTREQIHVGDKALIDHLDAYSAPRLVEYFDPDPCRILSLAEDRLMSRAAAAPSVARQEAQGLRVRVEGQ